MERKRFCVTFFLRRARTNKAGLAPILARITTNGVSKEVYIQCSVPADRWNQSKEWATGRDKLCQQVNAYLNEYRARILAIRQELISKGREGNCIEIKNLLLNPAAQSKQFLSEFGQYCEKRQGEVGVRITQLTANKYHRLYRYLKEYTTERYKKDDLLLAAVDYAYIDGLNTFMQTAHNCKNNGAVNLLCCLKNFMLYALRNEWIEKNPFQHYKMKPEHNKDKDHLTKAELETLIRKEMPNERLSRIRDVFAFCCLTGLAFTDVDHLRPEHIGADANGTLWIHKPRAGPDAADTEQQQNERLPQGDSDDLQYRQDADDARRPPHVRLPCRGVRNADRRAGEDSGTLQYEYDAPLREILGTAYRPGDAEDRPSVRRGKLNDGNRIRNRASELLTALMPGYYLISLFLWFFWISHFSEKFFEG